MFEESVYYQDTDVLLMDPCFSRDDDNDIDSELYCSDLVVYTYADGYYHAIRGRLDDMMNVLDEVADNPEQYSLGGIDVESGRIGIYDYHNAVKEQPELVDRIKNKEVYAAIIKNFTGTITTVTDDDFDVFVVGKSEDGEHDFFTVAFYD